ncbi:MAG: uroporphyrinogen decarboxylase family protein, partial [Eubacterium sp.]
SVRGLVGILKDMRTYPDKIAAACEAMEPLLEATGELGFRAPNRDFPFIFMPTLIPHFIKTKDFEKFYFPTFKKLVCNLAEKGFNFVIQFEGNWERFYDCLQDLPKNKIFGIFEFGDPQLAKDKLGKNMVVSGFYPLTLLGMGRPQECVDKAKEIVDILAPGGGYIFTTDKQIMNIKDAVPENLIQVYDFVNRYAVH